MECGDQLGIVSTPRVHVYLSILSCGRNNDPDLVVITNIIVEGGLRLAYSSTPVALVKWIRIKLVRTLFRQPTRVTP